MKFLSLHRWVPDRKTFGINCYAAKEFLKEGDMVMLGLWRDVLGIPGRSVAHDRSWKGLPGGTAVT